MEGTVVKNCPALVYPPSHRHNNNATNDDQGLDVIRARKSSPALPLYAMHNNDTMLGASDETHTIKLLTDFVVRCIKHDDKDERCDPLPSAQKDDQTDCSGDQNASATTPPPTTTTTTTTTTRTNRAPDILHCAGTILSVNILGKYNWRRTFTLDQAVANPFTMFSFVPLRGVEFVVPSAMMEWQACMQGLFEWMNRAALGYQYVNESIARDKALRLFWCSTLVLLQFTEYEHEQGAALLPPSAGTGERRRRRNWTPLPQFSNSSRVRQTSVSVSRGANPNAVRKAIATLQNFQMGISVPDGVEVDDMNLTYPFNEVWNAAQTLMVNGMGNAEGYKRDWFKELLASSAVSVSSTLLASKYAPPSSPLPYPSTPASV